MWLRMRKSSGRKRQVWPFQCTPAPPTPLPGRKLPHLRIGSAVCDGIVAHGQRFLLRPQEDIVAHRIAQFVRRGADVEIGGGVAPRPALDGDDLEAGARQFIGEDRSGPAETDDDDILAGQTAGHQFCPSQAGRPCMRTGGSV